MQIHPETTRFFFPKGRGYKRYDVGCLFHLASVDCGFLIYQVYDLGMLFGRFSYSEWQFKVKIMLGKNVGEI